MVQSVPEHGLAHPDAPASAIAPTTSRCRYRPTGIGAAQRQPVPAPAEWKVSAMNDQHAYLRFGSGAAPQVGDLVGLGISHPCTTFDKWRWMAVVDERYDVVDAITTCF